MKVDFQPIDLGELKSRPLVTVIMSNYNYGHYIGASIESVLRQTYENFELVICDDGSSDDSVARVTAYAKQDARVRLIEQSNAGQAAAWNTCLRSANGEVVCILDSDDAFEPSKLQQTVDAFLQNANVGIVNHPMMVVDGTDNELWLTPRNSRLDSGWLGPAIVRRRGGWKGMFGSALSFRRTLIDLITPIPEDFGPAHADAYLVRIAPLLSPVLALDAPLTRYRFHGANVTNGAGSGQLAEQLRSRTIRGARIGEAVNARLRELGFDERQILLEEHATSAFLLALVSDESLLQRCRLYWPSISTVAREDFHSPLKRVAKAGVLTAGLVLPPSMRTNLVDRFFSSSSRTFNGRGVPGRSRLTQSANGADDNRAVEVP